MALSTVFSDDLLAPLFSFDRLMTRPSQGGGGATQLMRGIPIDVVEKDKSIEVKADVPGVDKKDIKLNVDGDVLTIDVQKTEGQEAEDEQDGVKVHRSERSAAFARRQLRLPDNVDPSQIKAEYKNGTLDIEIPKTEKTQPEQIEVS